MSVTYQATCPHCGTERAGFVCIAEQPHMYTQGDRPRFFSLAFSCPFCFGLIGVRLRSNSGATTFVHGRQGELSYLVTPSHGSSATYAIESTYPQKTKSKTPEHLSESVARCFYQAEDNRLRTQHDAAGAMYRKCLDLATKELDSSLTGKKLAARIDALHEKGLLTDALKEWAHTIRLDGNDASHEADELTKEEVQQLASFSELFLRYTFTLPKQVELRKADQLGAQA